MNEQINTELENSTTCTIVNFSKIVLFFLINEFVFPSFYEEEF